MRVPPDAPEGRSTRRTTKGVNLPRDGGANPDDMPGTAIDKIVAQYQRYGTLPAVPINSPLYGDFTFPDDIHSMREAVYAAEERFNALPSAVRKVCDNDWTLFLDKFNDPEARDELVAAGLVITENPPPRQPPSEPVSNAPTTPPETPPDPAA